jgi:hypothetical protein
LCCTDEETTKTGLAEEKKLKITPPWKLFSKNCTLQDMFFVTLKKYCLSSPLFCVVPLTQRPVL